MAYDGETEGGACDSNKACDQKKNLMCDTQHGVCVKFTGRLGDPCQSDANCSIDFPGLKCGNISQDTKFGKCECTADSKVFDLCDAGKICVQQGATPGPPGPPSGSCWPDSPFPTVTPAIGQGSSTCAISRGSCATADLSKFKGDIATTCGPIKFGVVGQPKKDSSGNQPAVQCKEASEWVDSLANAYSDICFFTKA